MIVYVIDGDFDRFVSESFPFSAHSRNTTIKLVRGIDRSTSISVIVSRIAQAAERHRTIWLLRLFAHANAGCLNLGAGLNAENARKFQQLSAFMTPERRGGRGIEIHGCSAAATVQAEGVFDGGSPTQISEFNARNPGQGGQGYSLMKALASAVGVPVRAALWTQVVDAEFRFEGPTVKVYPSGAFIEYAAMPRFGESEWTASGHHVLHLQ
jgi:hypothetical protein